MPSDLISTHSMRGGLHICRQISRLGRVVGVFVGLSISHLQATTISSTPTDIADTTPGEDRWEYSYFVSDYSFLAGQGFTIYFDRSLYTLLESPPPTVSIDWDAITIQPDTALASDGFYDAQATVDTPSLANLFRVKFVWLGSGTPGPQPFAVYNPQFAPLEQGLTVVPEPSGTVLSLTGLAALAGRRRHPPS